MHFHRVTVSLLLEAKAVGCAGLYRRNFEHNAISGASGILLA